MDNKDKLIWKTMWILIIFSLLSFLIELTLISIFMPGGVWMLIAICVACIIFFIPCFFALKLEVSVGTYKCKHCGYEIVPTYGEALRAMHIGTTRHLKCPKCNKKSWCRKVLSAQKSPSPFMPE